MPSLMLFDLDGTVLDGSGLPEAMRRTCAALATALPGVAADDLVAANTAVWERLWPEVEDDYMLGGRAGSAVGRDAWRATLASCGVHDPAALELAIATWDREERASLRLFPDVLPTLEGFAARGVRIGMVTNGAATVQRDKLAALGIADRFDPLVISSEAGAKKPDPAIFEIALAAAAVPAADAWFVGDNLWHDVPGAVAAGVHAVWLDRHGVQRQADWPQPDRVVGSLTVLTLLDAESPKRRPDA